MVFSLAFPLLFGAFAAVSAEICPFVIIAPPPGTDIGLCSSTCWLQCFYEQETNGQCSNGPASYAANNAALDAEIVRFEVLSDKACAIFSGENCGGVEVAFIQGPGSVSINTTDVGSVICN